MAINKTWLSNKKDKKLVQGQRNLIKASEGLFEDTVLNSKKHLWPGSLNFQRHNFFLGKCK